MSRVMSQAFHKIQMQPLKPSASERQTLSKPREELTKSALWPEMQSRQEVARLCVQSEVEGYEIHWGVQHGVGGNLKQSTLCCIDMIVTASSLSMKGRRIRELSRLRYAVKASQVWQCSTLKASAGCSGDLHGDGLLCGEFQHLLKQ
nr:hypothetical protein CFP56_58573 [Quercus suber]